MRFKGLIRIEGKSYNLNIMQCVQQIETHKQQNVNVGTEVIIIYFLINLSRS